jgi:hypothetical protein
MPYDSAAPSRGIAAPLAHDLVIDFGGKVIKKF